MFMTHKDCYGVKSHLMSHASAESMEENSQESEELIYNDFTLVKVGKRNDY